MFAFDVLKCFCGLHENGMHSCNVPQGALHYTKCERCDHIGDGMLNGVTVSAAFVASVLKRVEAAKECPDLNSWL